MSIALLALALQLSAPLSLAARRPVTSLADSSRDLSHVMAAQRSFERSRRALLPPGYSSDGRCDVRLGRFCWWYDGGVPHFPPESETIGVRRRELLAELDSAAARHPGDNWIAGMRVHYRIDGREYALADSAARACRGDAWWCAALVGYAAHARGDERAADSAFTAQLAAMPADSACGWKSIAPLLGDDRDTYEHLPCGSRAGVEQRYWTLARPRLDGQPNEWKNEFYTRRVITWLSERSATPHLLSWGDDAAELVLRYGWPVAWSKVQTSGVGYGEPSIIGHDPSPSFPFAAKVLFKDSLAEVPPTAWVMDEVRAESRYAPRNVRRVGAVSAQFARFRRGDSTLIVAAFAAHDDSLLKPVVTLGAVSPADSVSVSIADTLTTGRARMTVASAPYMAGLDVADTATGTLLRTRMTFVAASDSASLGVSDILVYRAGEDPATELDSALVRAIPGDTASRTVPLGLFWESYGLPTDGTPVDVSVSVERVDHSWIRSTKQHLGLTPVDTPIHIKWTESRPMAGRSVSLNLTGLDTGRYRFTLTVSRADGGTASSTREMELTDH